METPVQQVLGNKDLATQIFPFKLRRALNKSLRSSSYAEVASFVIKHCIHSDQGAEWIDINPTALFEMYIECYVYSRHYGACYSTTLFSTDDADDYFFFEENSDDFPFRSTFVRSLDVEDIVRAIRIKDLDSPKTNEDNDRELRIDSIALRLVYIEKYKYILEMRRSRHV